MNDESNIKEFSGTKPEPQAGDEALHYGQFIQKSGLTGYINVLMNIGSTLFALINHTQNLEERLQALENGNGSSDKQDS